MTGWSVDTLSLFQSFVVKLVLLGGVVGFLFIVNPLPSSIQTTHNPRPAKPLVQITHHVRVDINHGSPEALQTLPGIGAVLAERIVEYRREHGNFLSATDIQNIKGIGVKRLEQIRPYIRVAQPEGSSGR